MSSSFITASSQDGGEFMALGATLPPSGACSTSLSTPPATVEIEFPDAIRRLDAAFTPETADAADIGWYAAADPDPDPVKNGDLEADTSEHVVYVDDHVTVVPEPFAKGGTRHRFAVVSDGRVDLLGNRLTELNGLEFQLPVRDGDSVLAAMLVTKDSLSCKLRLYDVPSRASSTYLDSADFVHPLHGTLDRTTGLAYIADEYRTHGGVIHNGGSLGIVDLADGTTEFVDAVGNQPLFLPRAVSVGGDVIAVADTGNHRIVLAERETFELRSIIAPDFMRFPHAVEVSRGGTLLIKAFDKDYMTPVTIHADTSGNIAKKMYSMGVMGWDDISGRLFSGGVFVVENGRDSERGVHVVPATGDGIAQRRLTGDKVPIAAAAGDLYGDMMLVFEDDIILGLAPGGLVNGFATLPGASSGSICANHMRHSFLIASKSDSAGSVTEVELDIDSAELRAKTCRAIDFRPDIVYSTYYASEPVLAAGAVLRKYNVALDEILWETTVGGDVTAIEEDELAGVLLVKSEDDLYFVDTFTGTIYEEYNFSGEMAYCRRRRYVYRLYEERVSRYILTLSRASASSVSVSISHSKTAEFEGATAIDVQEGTDHLWIAAGTKLYNVDILLNVVSRSELWDSISQLIAINRPTAVYEPTVFDSGYTLKHSGSTGKFGAVFRNNRLVTYDELTESYATLEAASRTLNGLDLEGVTGDFYCSADSSGTGSIIKVNAAATQVLHDKPEATSGDLLIYNNEEAAIEASFAVDEAELDGKWKFEGTFTAVKEGGTGEAIAAVSSSGPSSRELPFGYVQQESSTPDKIVPVDIWHLENNGMEGTKLSVDYAYSFVEYEKGELRRVPVFRWDYGEDIEADAFAIGFSNLANRQARVTGGYVDMESEDAGLQIRSAAVFEDKLAVAGDGQVIIYDYLTFTQLTSGFVVDDVAVLAGRGAYLWCASASRGQVYRMDAGNLAKYDTYDIPDAPRSMAWSEARQGFVLACDSTLHYVSEEGEIETFYNVEDYTVVDMDVYGDYVAASLQSYDAIPLSEEYADVDDYNAALAARSRDLLLVIDRNNFPFRYQQELAADERIEFARMGNGRLLLATRKIIGGLDKDIYVSVVDLATETILSTASVETISDSVGAAYLSATDGIVIGLKNGDLVFADSQGYIEMGTPIQEAASSSSSSSSSGAPGLPPQEPEKITTISRTSFQFPEQTAAQLNGGSSSWAYNFHDRIQVLVGSSAGASDLWDSGAISTAEPAVLYGGGNNLEPGQRYWVSIRPGTPDEWGPYTTKKFVMGHFDNYPGATSSSSSSSARCVLLQGGDAEYLNGVDGTCVAIDLSGPESASIYINGVWFVVASNGLGPVWDYGTEREYQFTYVGESITRVANSLFFTVTYQDGSVYLYFAPAASSSCSSSSSSCSSSYSFSSQSISLSSSCSGSQSFSSESASPSSSSSESSSSGSFMANTYSVEFDGSNDYISLASTLTLSKSASSLSLWFKAPTSVFQNTFVGHSSNGDNINLNTDTQIGIQAGVFNAAFPLSSDVADGNWHLLVFRRNGGSDNRIYVDGIESTGGTGLANADMVLDRIGRIGSSYEWQGNIDEIAVWNKALSSAERAELYAAECPGNLFEHSASANLTHWWRMGDGDTYPTITDIVGGNDGTMTNMNSGDIVADVPACSSSSSSS